MPKFHIDNEGNPSLCKAIKGKCPFGGTDEHYPTKSLAREAFEKNNSYIVDMNNQLYRNGKRKYPKEILEQLSETIVNSRHIPLAIIPNGSDLYNSKIPGKPVHDYDFIVLTTPTKSKIDVRMNGELDISFIDVTKMDEVYEKSTQFMEVFFGRKYYGLYENKDNVWNSYMNAYNIPPEKYFALISVVISAHKKKITLPVEYDSKDFKNFKHIVRWTLYQRRWAQNNRNFDPRLTDSEKDEYLRILKNGTI